MTKPKIAIYAIAKNEEKFAVRFAKTCALADYVVVADTGSTDNTVRLLKKNGVDVHCVSLQKFRFDEARNVSLALVPADADICISLDLDEVLPDGWRTLVEGAWKNGTNKLWYDFVWSWDKDGKPAVVYRHSKIHSRFGYKWVAACHEYIVPIDGFTPRETFVDGLEIHHFQDWDKPRSSYLTLLKTQLDENPNDSRSVHYYGRELFFAGHLDSAKKMLESFHKMERRPSVYDAITHKYLAMIAARSGDTNEAKRQWHMAALTAGDWREPWIEYIKLSMAKNDWIGGVYAANEALRIQTVNNAYYSDVSRWDLDVYDLGSICAHYAGMKELASEWMRAALAIDDKDPRLLKNAEFIL